MADKDLTDWGPKMLSSGVRDSIHRGDAEDLRAVLRELENKHCRKEVLKEIGEYVDEYEEADFSDIIVRILQEMKILKGGDSTGAVSTT